MFIMDVLYSCRLSPALNKQRVDPSYDICELLDKNSSILPPIKKEEWAIYQKFVEQDKSFNDVINGLDDAIKQNKKNMEIIQKTINLLAEKNNSEA